VNAWRVKRCVNTPGCARRLGGCGRSEPKDNNHEGTILKTLARLVTTVFTALPTFLLKVGKNLCLDARYCREDAAF
jgi:hypothetical protein